MVTEDLMRKYKYGYIHSCELLEEPFIKDLLKENQQLKDNWNKLKEWFKNNVDKPNIKFILETMQELEQGSDSNDS